MSILPRLAVTGISPAEFTSDLRLGPIEDPAFTAQPGKSGESAESSPKS